MKVTKTYSIEESLYNAFDSLTTEKNINKSSFIENLIKKFLQDNDFEFIDKIYVSRYDTNHTITVLSQDLTYYNLSDGSKMQKILFMHYFKELETVEPTEFFTKSNKIFENLATEVKKIEPAINNDIRLKNSVSGKNYI